MTAQTPAPKASSVSALLASFSNVPPSPQPSAEDNFLSVILQAEMAQPSGTDSPAAAQPGQEAQKPAPANPEGPDLTGVSLLLAWLTPPLATLPQIAAKKVANTSSQAAAEATSAQPSPARNVAEAKSAKVDDTGKLPSSKEPQGEPSPSANKIASADKLLHAQVDLLAPKEAESKATPSSGTSVANTSQRMSFTPERNEIAGRTEQKLPPTAISAVSGADMGGPSSDSGAKSSLSFSWHDSPPEPLTITDLSTQATIPAAPAAAATTAEAPATASSAAPLERLEQMISHEALVIRQSGAQTLGVTLRLDTDTQLFLQLTTHNGSVQASVRLERGNFAPEEAQWAQLQQSLARQNVALLPMTGGPNLNFQQPTGHHSRQQAAARENWGLGDSAVQPAQPRKQKEQNRSRRNWESWA